MNVQTLYRPIGITELELIINSGYREFPPRLEWQPIFYPVLNQRYAEQIASEWNTLDKFSGYCGIVTQFAVNKQHLQQYDIQNVGGETHDELWVPAAQLSVFNQNIIGNIKVIKVFFGPDFRMPESNMTKEVLSKARTNEL